MNLNKLCRFYNDAIQSYLIIYKILYLQKNHLIKQTFFFCFTGLCRTPSGADAVGSTRIQGREGRTRLHGSRGFQGPEGRIRPRRDSWWKGRPRAAGATREDRIYTLRGEFVYCFRNLGLGLAWMLGSERGKICHFHCIYWNYFFNRISDWIIIKIKNYKILVYYWFLRALIHK